MIVSHSSGNHGQAVAWAAATANIPSTIVVPAGTPEVKVSRGHTGTLGHSIVITPPGNNDNEASRMIKHDETSPSPANISPVT